MNKTKKKKALKIALWIVIGIVGLVILTTGFFAVRGAVMWSNAKSGLSIAQAAENFRTEENFTSYDKLPQFYIDAVISVEDRKFFSHGGINVKSIIRAALYDIKNQSLDQGGSTITQQLAKNVWFSQEKHLERKFAEVWAAFDLEKELDKNEIFELYANTIYFGSDYYGIKAAARGYFGKEPAELSEYECAMLAGLPNAPSVYSLNENPDLARQRLEQVLDAMLANGKITDEKRLELLNNN